MTTNSHSEDIARSGVEADASSTEGLLILNGILGLGGRIFALQRVEFNSAEKEMNH